MSLLANAVDSIQVGVEDLLKSDDRRVSSAVRNVHAGVLLLCKEKLHRLSPRDDLLLAQRYEPRRTRAGKIELVPVGRKTVGVERKSDSASKLLGSNLTGNGSKPLQRYVT